MLDDFIGIKTEFPVKDYRDGITIVPLSDAHYGSREFNSVRWHEAVKRIQDDPKCFCVLVGDMIDNGLKNSVTNVYDATCSPKEQKEWLYQELTPIKDKILAAVGGNHERRSIRESDQDPMYDVMCRLGIEDKYRRTIAFLSVGFTYDSQREWTNKNRVKTAYTFVITHGAGGGMYIGSGANRVQNFGTMIDGIDCIITGHTHKPMTFPVAKLVYDARSCTVTRVQFTVVVASSLLDYGGYPVEKLMTPTASTLTEIVIESTGEGKGRRRLRVIQ